MTDPTDEEVRCVAESLEENCGECNWMSRRQTANLARAAIAAIRAMDREKAEDSRPRKLPEIRRIAEADDGALEGDL